MLNSTRNQSIYVIFSFPTFSEVYENLQVVCKQINMILLKGTTAPFVL